MPKLSLATKNRRWRGENYAVMNGLYRARTDFIYFAQAEDGGPIKIGRSRQPSKRVADMSRSSPVPLRITRLVPVHESKCELMERNLHKHFSHVRLHDEWFEPDEELIKLAHGQGRHEDPVLRY